MDSDEFNLGKGGGVGCEEVPVKVRRQSFRRFSRRMDRQLAELVARWVDQAAPCAAEAAERRIARTWSRG